MLGVGRHRCWLQQSGATGANSRLGGLDRFQHQKGGLLLFCRVNHTESFLEIDPTMFPKLGRERFDRAVLYS